MQTYYRFVPRIPTRSLGRNLRYLKRGLFSDPCQLSKKANRIGISIPFAGSTRQAKHASSGGQLDAWRDYVESVCERHSQKSKLAPMLDELLAEF